MTVSKHTMLFSVFIIRDFTSWQNSAYIKYLRNYGYMSSKNCIDSIIECRYQILDDELFINAMILDFGYPGIIKSIWQPNYNYLQESPSRNCFFNILNSTRSKTFFFFPSFLTSVCAWIFFSTWYCWAQPACQACLLPVQGVWFHHLAIQQVPALHEVPITWHLNQIKTIPLWQAGSQDNVITMVEYAFREKWCLVCPTVKIISL